MPSFLYVQSGVFYLLILDFIVNQLHVLFATLTNISMTGTSTNTPTTVTSAAPVSYTHLTLPTIA